MLTRMSPTVICLLLHVLTSQAGAASVVNRDFETGDLAGWTTFATSNGVIGHVAVLDVDITGDGRVTRSAAFKVGQGVYQGLESRPEGGGIDQSIEVGPGRVTLAADIAVAYSSARHARNISGGLFELILDDVVLDAHDFGPIKAGTTERATLRGSTEVERGVHTLRVRIRRPAVAKLGTPAPVQFVDNVRLTLLP